MNNSLLQITANESLLEIKELVDKLVHEEREHRAEMAQSDLTTGEAIPEYVSWRNRLIEDHRREVADAIAEIRQMSASFFPPCVSFRVRQEYLLGVEKELDRIQRQADEPYGLSLPPSDVGQRLVVGVDCRSNE